MNVHDAKRMMIYGVLDDAPVSRSYRLNLALNEYCWREFSRGFDESCKNAEPLRRVVLGHLAPQRRHIGRALDCNIFSVFLKKAK
jgi:hypothetical protein